MPRADSRIALRLARSRAAALLGSIKSPKKAKAARRNGRLGGRRVHP